MPESVVFIGGPVDRQRADLTRTPPQVSVLGVLYHRIDDPDTGSFLGGYVTEAKAEVA
jgi:hypothetical protein